MNYDLPEEVQVAADGGVRIVTLNRPEARNAFNRPMLHGFTAVWAQMAEDREARAAVLTGAGRVFSAGGDMGWIDRTIEDPWLRHQSIREAEALVRSIAGCPLPIVAALNGPAVGLAAA